MPIWWYYFWLIAIKQKQELDEEEWENGPYKQRHSRYQKRFHRELGATERQIRQRRIRVTEPTGDPNIPPAVKMAKILRHRLREKTDGTTGSPDAEDGMMLGVGDEFEEEDEDVVINIANEDDDDDDDDGDVDDDNEIEVEVEDEEGDELAEYFNRRAVPSVIQAAGTANLRSSPSLTGGGGGISIASSTVSAAAAAAADAAAASKTTTTNNNKKKKKASSTKSSKALAAFEQRISGTTAAPLLHPNSPPN